MSGTPPPIDWGRVKRFLLFCLAALAATVVVGVVYWSLLLPLFLAALIAYLLLPLVDRLERLGATRGLAVLVLILSTVAVVAFAATRIIPMLLQQAQLVLRLIPIATSMVLQSWLPLAEKYVSELGIMTAEQAHRLIGQFDVLGQLESQAQAGLAGLWYTGTSLAGGVLNLVLVPFVTFFLLKDWRKIAAGLKALVPRDLETPVAFVMARVNLTLRSVIKGQAIVAGILAVLYSIGLGITGLQSAVAIGVVAGICRVIPYLDVVVGATLSTVVILSDFQGWGQVVSVMLVFLVVQAVDGAFITPRVIGERVGLHPMVVVLSVLAFAHWLGFWGVLIAIPVVAIVKVLLSAAQPFYLASRAYRSAARGGAESEGRAG